LLLGTLAAPRPDLDELRRFIKTEDPGHIAVEARVRSARLLPPGEDYLSAIIDIRRVRLGESWRDIEGRAQLRWTNPAGPLAPGDVIRAQGRPSHWLGPVNPHVRGRADYLHARGVHSVFRTRGGSVEVLAPAAAWHPSAAAHRFRSAMAARLRAVLPPGVRDFAMAVWMGERGALAGDYDQYIASGTAHILAVSGLHAGLVYAAAAGLLRMFIRRRRLRTLMVLIILAGFTLLAGARTSTLRAFLMISAYLAADFFDRERDAPSALALAAVVLLAWRPNLIADVGFQLSFLSVASILLLAEPLAARLQMLPDVLARPLSATLAVQVLPLPAAIAAFHIMPLAAPAANLVVVPLLAAVLVLMMGVSALAWLWPAAAQFFAHALIPPVACIHGVQNAVAWEGLTWFRVPTPPWHAAALFVAALALLAGALQYRRSRRLWLAAAVAVVAASALWRFAPAPAEVVFLDVGQGDSTFIRSREGFTALVDGGNRTEYIDYGETAVAPFLMASGAGRLDYVCATHADSDHVGGLITVLEEFSVGAVIVPIGAAGDAAATRLQPVCERRGIPVRSVAAGDVLTLGSTKLEVLHPTPGFSAGNSENDGSLVLRVHLVGRRGSGTVLLPGDVERAAEAALVANGPLRADVLKAPHHGSRTSSSPAFVDAVAPAAAIASTGGSRGREAVDPGVMSIYASRRIELWRTDLHGGILLRPGKQGLQLQAERIRRGY
jgi:competence protein ComEC